MTLGNIETWTLEYVVYPIWFVYFSATEGEDRKLCEGNEIKNENMENCNNKIATYCHTDQRALKANILGLCWHFIMHMWWQESVLHCFENHITEFGQYDVSWHYSMMCLW